jgi:hypothetical protein
MADLPVDLPVFTYQPRIHLQPPQNEALEAYAELYLGRLPEPESTHKFC